MHFDAMNIPRRYKVVILHQTYYEYMDEDTDNKTAENFEPSIVWLLFKQLKKWRGHF